MVRVLSTFRVVRGWHAPLAWMAVAMAGLAVVSATGWVLDDRTLVGQPIWTKPLKFALSFAVYALTLAWMTSLLGRWRRVGWWAGTVLVVASLAEMVIITAQVLRGRQSHFNIATDLDAALFNAMGALVAVIYVSTLVIGVVLLRNPSSDPAATWAVRLGVLIAVAGLSVGFLMLGQTPDQAAAAAAGAQPTLAGAHSVGVADGGAGLPLLGWSTTGGDLRVGHFLGMHALQALPLLAMALRTPRGRALGDPTRLRIVLVAAMAYAGLVAITVWQALRGQPLLAPDLATLAALAALALVTGLGAAVTARTARAHPAPQLSPSAA